MDNELNYNKAKLFFDLGWKVHITRSNGFVNNGILEEVNADFLLINDERKGSMPLFFIEIVDIEKFEEVK